ncbi:MAG: hypothetical protein B7Z81_05570 [Acidocella sp. 20-61-6]|nr:MAG: hypothetical protein B7Z81_05570 [Acidocella sp. 20-61-6]
MNRVIQTVLSSYSALSSDRRGVTAIEYVLIASLIAVVIVVGVTLTGHGVSSSFKKVATGI